MLLNKRENLFLTVVFISTLAFFFYWYGNVDNQFIEIIPQEEMIDKRTPRFCDSQMDIEAYFTKYLYLPSDINEHMETLRRYAQECESVAELGTRHVVSTWAFAMAGVDRFKKNLPFSLLAMDITQQPEVIGLLRIMHQCEVIEFNFIEGDDLKTPFNPIDLLFIDTWHTYSQLIAELHHLSIRAKKYIILHDTSLFEWQDEGDAGHGGKPIDDTLRGSTKYGLWTAVTEFLDSHSEWKLKERFTNNNGLTVLMKQ